MRTDHAAERKQRAPGYVCGLLRPLGQPERERDEAPQHGGGVSAATKSQRHRKNPPIGGDSVGHRDGNANDANDGRRHHPDHHCDDRTGHRPGARDAVIAREFRLREHGPHGAGHVFAHLAQ